MLILSRKRNESVVISDTITITVLGIQGNRIRIGIEAPDDVPVHRQEVADAMTAPRGTDLPTLDIANRSLLVVSNDDPTRAAVAGMLARKGGNVDTADSCACAMEYADEKRYDVAIIDERLTKARGQELFQRMRNYQSGLKGILCSTRPTLDTVESAVESGMDHVLQKPIDQAELLSLVQD